MEAGQSKVLLMFNRTKMTDYGFGRVVMGSLQASLSKVFFAAIVNVLWISTLLVESSFMDCLLRPSRRPTEPSSLPDIREKRTAAVWNNTQNLTQLPF